MLLMLKVRLCDRSQECSTNMYMYRNGCLQVVMLESSSSHDRHSGTDLGRLFHKTSSKGAVKDKGTEMPIAVVVSINSC